MPVPTMSTVSVGTGTVWGNVPTVYLWWTLSVQSPLIIRIICRQKVDTWESNPSCLRSNTNMPNYWAIVMLVIVNNKRWSTHDLLTTSPKTSHNSSHAPFNWQQHLPPDSDCPSPPLVHQPNNSHFGLGCLCMLSYMDYHNCRILSGALVMSLIVSCCWEFDSWW